MNRYEIKNEMLNALNRGETVVVVDPECEYADICHKVHGTEISCFAKSRDTVIESIEKKSSKFFRIIDCNTDTDKIADELQSKLPSLILNYHIEVEECACFCTLKMSH